MVRSLLELEEYRDCKRRVMKIRSAYLETREPFRQAFTGMWIKDGTILNF